MKKEWGPNPLVRVSARVSFGALTLLVGWQEGHLLNKKPCPIKSQRFSSETGGQGGSEGERGNQLTKVHLEKWPLQVAASAAVHVCIMHIFFATIKKG